MSTTSGLGSLLSCSDILPLIVSRLPRGKDRTVLRLASSSVRSAYDKQASSIRTYAQQQLPYNELADKFEAILKRGCRPRTVDLRPNVPPEEKFAAVHELLCRCTTASGQPPLPTRELFISALVLDGFTAASVGCSFPDLEILHLDMLNGEFGGPSGKDAYDRSRAEALDEFADGLKHLLGANEYSTQRLTHLGLNLPHDCDMPPRLAQALSGGTQLTTLMAYVRLDRAGVAEPLSRLRSLKDLLVSFCEQPLLAPLLSPLTALTSLRLGSTSCELPAAALTGLHSLANLSATYSTLSVSTLAQLSSLTGLCAQALILSDDDRQALQTAPHRCDWRLPAKLEDVYLEEQAADVLGAMRGSPAHVAKWEMHLTAGQAFLDLQGVLSEDDFLVTLTERGEAGLASCMEFLAGRMSRDSEIYLDLHCYPILPVGGLAEAGPGRRNHTPWLAPLARAGVPELILEHLALSEEDFAAVASNAQLRKLQVYETCRYPWRALLQLAEAPALEKLGVDIDKWCGEEQVGPFAPPPDAASVLATLLAGTPPRLSVELRYYEQALSEETEAEVWAWYEAAQEAVEEAGADLDRLSLHGG